MDITVGELARLVERGVGLAERANRLGAQMSKSVRNDDLPTILAQAASAAHLAVVGQTLMRSLAWLSLALDAVREGEADDGLPDAEVLGAWPARPPAGMPEALVTLAAEVAHYHTELARLAAWPAIWRQGRAASARQNA